MKGNTEVAYVAVTNTDNLRVCKRLSLSEGFYRTQEIMQNNANNVAILSSKMHLTDSFQAWDNINVTSSEMHKHIDLTSLRVMVI
jgi:hypothetical protein